jgi:hypothetical protein
LKGICISIIPLNLQEALHKYLPIFLSDVKARHDKMVEMVETMLKLHGRLAEG